MPVQTANTLFRFTPKLNYLLKSLSTGFTPRLSKEVTIKGEPVNYPMICFCDIPLAMTDNHMALYGDYGIGLTKEWGIQNGLNPILYYNEDSILIENFFGLVNEGIDATHKLYGLGVGAVFHDVGPGLPPYLTVDQNVDGYAEKNMAFWHAVNRLIAIQGLERYFKPRVGAYEIGGNTYDNYHFYDEREWRFLPYKPLFDPGDPYLNKQENTYPGDLDDVVKATINGEIEAKGEYNLTFGIKDIKYLIVKDEGEIIQVVQHLESLQNSAGDKQYSHDEIVLLTSRILTKKQIREDF